MNVFEQIKEKCLKNSQIGRSSFAEFLKILDEVEKEHNNGWIACKDKLPEENQRVICSLDNGSVFILDYYGGAFCGVFKYDTNEVIAWQPLHLPPAYKECEEG